MKTLGIMMIIISCSAIGISLKRGYSQRTKALKAFINAFEIIKTEIVFKNRTTDEIVSLLAQKAVNPAKTLFIEIEKLMKSNKTYQESLSEAFIAAEKTGLTKGDLFEIKQGLSELGKYDSFTQSEKLSALINELDDFFKSAKDEEKKNGKLYGALGITAGIMLAIILI